MRELSLFSGAGGGLLATKHLLGWTTIGYVEYEPYCQEVIKARIADGYLDAAPIFGDIRKFVSDGYAEQYKGLVDVITAGFPCQPHSVAGKQLGGADERDMWPATRDVIRIVQPESVELENVTGLISSGYIGTVLSDLASMGYVGKWGVLRASDAGAKHIRARVWIVAHADRDGLQERERFSGARRAPEKREQARDTTDRISTPTRQCGQQSLGREIGRTGRQRESIQRNGDWTLTTEPVLGRGTNGLAHRLDRLRAIGNGQVPAVVRRAWHELSLPGAR